MAFIKDANSLGTKHVVVIPLWRGVIDVLIPFLELLERGTKNPKNCAVAAILPGQQLDPEMYDALEAAGLLAIEVPESLRDADCSTIIAYLDKALLDGSAATSARTATQPYGEAEGRGRKPLTKKEKEEFLKAINDPNNVL